MNTRRLKTFGVVACVSVLAAASGCNLALVGTTTSSTALSSTAFGQLGPVITESMATQLTGLGTVPIDVLGGTTTTATGTVVSPVQPTIGTTLAGPTPLGMDGSQSVPSIGTLGGL